ncbi:MAG: hypothetical protein IBX45_06355 [Campylobacterales bacterium]|nr:hypothetical protein [Campylobacterales bacterium]
MSYSFIAPKPKPLFSLFSKIWLVFIGLTLFLMGVFNFFVVYKISAYQTQSHQLIALREEYHAKIESSEAQIAFIEHQKAVAEGIYASNDILRESIKNLFDLVPDQITLSRVVMEKNALVIYGKTPSKETYNFLLASPLRSIFHASNTVFYLDNDGWYRFVSTNKIIDSAGFNE